MDNLQKAACVARGHIAKEIERKAVNDVEMGSGTIPYMPPEMFVKSRGRVSIDVLYGLFTCCFSVCVHVCLCLLFVCVKVSVHVVCWYVCLICECMSLTSLFCSAV